MALLGQARPVGLPGCAPRQSATTGQHRPAPTVTSSRRPSHGCASVSAPPSSQMTRPRTCPPSTVSAKTSSPAAGAHSSTSTNSPASTLGENSSVSILNRRRALVTLCALAGWRGVLPCWSAMMQSSVALWSGAARCSSTTRAPLAGIRPAAVLLSQATTRSGAASCSVGCAMPACSRIQPSILECQTRSRSRGRRR